MNSVVNFLVRLVHHPMLDLTVGVILFVSGFVEVWETLPQDIHNGHLRGSHGVLVLGFVMALKALTDVFAGLEFMVEAKKVKK
jgi:hypothetical protein